MEDLEEDGSKKKTKGALEAASEKLGEVLDTGDDEEEEEVESRPRRRREKGRTSS